MNQLESLNVNGAQEFIRIIGRQLAETLIMVKILEEEQSALQHSNLQVFETVIQKKHLQTRKLKELESEMASLRHILSRPVSKASIELFIHQTTDKSVKTQLESLWKQLKQALKLCQQQNTINNRIIEASRVSMQQAIDIIRGGNSSPNTYRASGKKDGYSQNHSLAVA